MKHIALLICLGLLAVALISGCSKDDDNQIVEPYLPAAPSNLTATQATLSAIVLEWTDNSVNEDSFVVYRSTDTTAIPWLRLLKVGANVTTATDSSILPTQRYYYRVSAVNGMGAAAANPVMVYTWAAPTPPEIQSVSVVQDTRESLLIGWTVTNAESLTIAQSSDSAVWSLLAQVPALPAWIEVTAITRNTRYFLRCIASNPNGVSPFWNTNRLWTLPAIYDFSTASQLDQFTASPLENAAPPEWSFDAATFAGKITLPEAGPADSASLLTLNPMPEQGWFESKIKVQQWYGHGDSASYANLLLESDPENMETCVGLLLAADSTIFGHWSSSGGFQRLATNPTLPLLTANVFHTIRMLHDGLHWTLYLDAIPSWEGDVFVAFSGPVYQEWQFCGGNGPANQTFWVDDVANPLLPVAASGPAPRAIARHK